MSTSDLLGGKYDAADEENDSDAKSGAPSSEDEGGAVDLMGNNTDQDDSSDEGEDDSEEERAVKEGKQQDWLGVNQLARPVEVVQLNPQRARERLHWFGQRILTNWIVVLFRIYC